MSAEPSSNPQEMHQHYLAKRLSFRPPADAASDSVPTLYDVPLLTAGEWHDSLTPYPTVYTPQHLRQFTVEGSAGYRDHSFAHAMDEEIGDAANIRYDEAREAIVADLVFHGATQASRDTYAVIKRREEQGLPNYVSIEMMTRDVPTEKGMEAQDIRITGWIATTTPACKKCAIPTQHNQTMTETNETGDPKHLEGDSAASEEDKQKKAAEEENEEKKEASDEKKQEEEEKTSEPDEETKKLTGRIEALEAALHALEAKVEDGSKQLTERVHALEQKPNPHDRAHFSFSGKTSTTAPLAEYTTHNTFY